jgi:hypothetical protein
VVDATSNSTYDAGRESSSRSSINSGEVKVSVSRTSTLSKR